jgi:hypothetical protein
VQGRAPVAQPRQEGVMSEPLLCEHVGCDRPGWVVLYFGPNLTPPLRVACAAHQKVSDLDLFRERKGYES